MERNQQKGPCSHDMIRENAYFLQRIGRFNMSLITLFLLEFYV